MMLGVPEVEVMIIIITDCLCLYVRTQTQLCNNMHTATTAATISQGSFQNSLFISALYLLLHQQRK